MVKRIDWHNKQGVKNRKEKPEPQCKKFTVEKIARKKAHDYDSCSDRKKDWESGHFITIQNHAIPGIPANGVMKSIQWVFLKNTLLVGGDFAGNQAALEIANSNHKVYLLKRKGTIGNLRILYDCTFPTRDGAACFLTPERMESDLRTTIESHNFPFFYKSSMLE